MRRFRRLALLVVIAACSSDAPSGPSTTGPPVLGPTNYRVAGRWMFFESAGNAALSLTCDGHGLITVTQDGPRFTAAGVETGSCSVPGFSEGFTDSIHLKSGTINGTGVAFTVDDCPYSGTAHGALPDSVTGMISCSVPVNGTSVTITGQWRVVPPPDTAPPTVTGAIFGGGANDTLETGDDTLYVKVHAEDDNALRSVGYVLRDPSRGSVVRLDSIVFATSNVRIADDTLIFPLPLNLVLPYNRPFHLSVFARDTAKMSVEAFVDSFEVFPAKSPTVTSTLAGAINDTVGALRDTLEIHVTASGPRPLKYLGYRISTFLSQGDSIATTATSASHVFRLPIPFEWKGLLLRFQVFGRDLLGLEAQREAGSVRVVVLPSRPTTFFRVNQGVADVAYDPVRDRVYLATANDSGLTTGTPEIRVFQRSPAASLRGILLSDFPAGIDVAVDGDAVFTPRYNAGLVAIDLSTFAETSIDAEAFTPATGLFPFTVRALVDHRAFVTVAHASAIQLVEIDLATQTHVLRTDVGTAGVLGAGATLTRTSNRQRLLVYSSSPTATVQLYESSTNQFAAVAPIATPLPGGGGVSGNSTGTLWLVGNNLLGSDLASLRLLGSNSPQAVASVLSDDGAYAYVAVPEGVAKYRTTDGMEVERIFLPEPPYRLAITTDGQTLIAVGPWLALVDLQGPAPTRFASPLHRARAR